MCVCVWGGERVSYYSHIILISLVPLSIKNKMNILVFLNEVVKECHYNQFDMLYLDVFTCTMVH